MTEAKSLRMLQGSRDWLISVSPDLEALWQKYKKKGPDGEQDAPPSRTEHNTSRFAVYLLRHPH